MKTAYLTLALAVIGLSSCQNESEAIKAFIPGTYVKEAKSEFSIAFDTLTVSPLAGNAFQIDRSAGYQITRNGKTLPKKFKKQKQTGIYDPQKQVLEETANGRLFLFDPKRKVLLIGQAEYHKIN